jgi:protein O-GlcNAc transferase
MGVPVITYPGESCAGRHAAGHLWTIGHDELIAEDLAGYIELAAELAGDRDRLAGLRSGLRARVAASPLCDGPGFAADFLDAVRGLWRQRCP